MVLADSGWFESSYCINTPNCVSMRFGDGCVLLRDGKLKDGPVLEFDHDEWMAFLLGVFNGEFGWPFQHDA
jgi:hypothetical protein